jgi:3-oxoacyl-[acyl-carrier protein] reductase
VSRVALVSGGTRGIGFATAAALLKRGDQVALFCRHLAHARDAGKRLAALGAPGAVLALVGDVRSERDVAVIVRKTVARFGRIDLLVNNAGVIVYGAAEKTTTADWDAIVDTNLKGAFLLSRQVLPVMRAQGGGTIVNVASRMWVEARPGFAAYCASKFGLIGLTMVLAEENREAGIFVQAVLPGAVDTTMVAKLKGMPPGPKPELTPEMVAARILEAAECRDRSGELFEVTTNAGAGR